MNDLMLLETLFDLYESLSFESLHLLVKIWFREDKDDLLLRRDEPLLLTVDLLAVLLLTLFDNMERDCLSVKSWMFFDIEKFGRLLYWVV